TDDTAREPCTVVRLNTVRIDEDIAPTSSNQLLIGWRILTRRLRLSEAERGCVGARDRLIGGILLEDCGDRRITLQKHCLERRVELFEQFIIWLRRCRQCGSAEHHEHRNGP